MEVKLDLIVSSYLIWQSIWKKNTTNFTDLNIIDSIQLTKEGIITGWLFTSTAGKVKSKLSDNWKIEVIVNRCNNFQNDIVAHYYSEVMHKWIYVNNYEALQRFLSDESSMNRVLLCHPQLSKNSAYLEVQYIKHPQKKKYTIEVPQYTFHWLCDLMKGASGMKKTDEAISRSLSNEAISSQTIVCKDKDIIKSSRDYISNIVKIIENHIKVKVTCIKIVLVVINDGNYESKTRTLYLHHISSIIYTSITAMNGTMQSSISSASSRTNGIVPSYTELSSIGIGSSNLSLEATLSNSYAPRHCRVDVCHGDFCKYMTSIEALLMSGRIIVCIDYHAAARILTASDGYDVGYDYGYNDDGLH